MEQALIEAKIMATMPSYSHSVLLVDDSPVNLGVVVENLELQGYEVLVAQDGEEAIQRARNTQPDIILLDVMMPGIDGFDVCRSLKEDKSTSEIPVIFMTSLGRLEDKIKGFAAGAVDYVTKPLQMDELRVRLDVHLKLRDLQREVAVKNRKLEFEIEQRKRHEEELSLSEREFRTLAENSPDRIVRYNCDCRFVYVNPQFEQILGFGIEEVRGKLPTQVPSLPDAELFQQRVMEVIATGRADEFEHQLKFEDGQSMWTLVSIFPERDENGKTGFVQELSRNITGLKQAEKYLEESRAQLRMLLAHQEEVNEQERKQVFWDMHEDLLQVLSVMNLYASLLQADPSRMTESQVKILSSLKSGLGRSIKLVRETIGSLRPVAINLGVEAALEWLEAEFAQQPGMECQLEIQKQIVQMDEKSSLLVFRIVQEALAFTAKFRVTASVNVSLELRENGYLLTIRDKSKANGVDTANDDFLNLYGLQERVLATGGEMVVFSAPNHGLIVEAQLPFLQG